MQRLSTKMSTNVPIGFSLKNPCDWSFNDLITASRYQYTLTQMSQSLVNNEVKKMCVKAGWYWQDFWSTDGIEIGRAHV